MTISRLLFGMVAFCLSNMAIAAQEREVPTGFIDIDKRCLDDHLIPEHARGRNAWVVKCIGGAFTEQTAIAFNAVQMYAHFDGPLAPFDPSAPCEDPPRKYNGACVANGCFTPSQRIKFGGEYAPIGNAVGHAPWSGV